MRRGSHRRRSASVGCIIAGSILTEVGTGFFRPRNRSPYAFRLVSESLVIYHGRHDKGLERAHLGIWPIFPISLWRKGPRLDWLPISSFCLSLKETTSHLGKDRTYSHKFHKQWSCVLHTMSAAAARQWTVSAQRLASLPTSARSLFRPWRPLASRNVLGTIHWRFVTQ